MARKKAPTYEEVTGDVFHQHDREVVPVGGASYVGPQQREGIKVGFVRGYKAALEDHGIDALTEGEIAERAAGRF